MDTIYALATARGRAGVAVIRISGPDALNAASALCGSLPEPRRAALRKLRWKDELLDEALVLVFDVGESFTGEAIVELQLHGSPAAVSAVLRVLEEQPGLRPAEAGEFTRRALENGRLDLAQVEGLADLLEAETEAQRRQAMRMFSGVAGERAESWRRRLIRAAALIEATIDFADEDVPTDVAPEVVTLIEEVVAELRDQADTRVAERIREGFEVAIVGAPNAGKSTLLNALAGREAAITSEIAGTTRDVIEVRMDLHGIPVTFLDTAGLRVTQDVVESIGIERAISRANAADLRVFLIVGGDVPLVPAQPEDLIVQGKSDLSSGSGLRISGKTGEGVPELIDRITGIFSDRVSSAGIFTRERHRLAILSALGAMESARDEVLNGPDRAELAAEELRTALRALDSLVGRVDVEHILSEIFSSFCIGK